MLIHDYILHDFPGIKFTGGATQMSKPKGKAQSDWLKAQPLDLFDTRSNETLHKLKFLASQ